ncbi:MAG: alanine racemase C-terminal domain-containing protein, partial [Flavobacteriaceae bacterium]|nr:alanine racemase C-terminal domain-containing protein [Flavobacteriaceae bacterium]
PIGSLKTKISQITHVIPGSYIGYNRAFEAHIEVRSATLPVGYADGIAKIFSKQHGYVFIHGKRAPILGKICMDMMMVNVTDVPCQEGDDVIIFDKNHSAAALAEDAGTISYELITSIGSRVKRVFINE